MAGAKTVSTVWLAGAAAALMLVPVTAQPEKSGNVVKINFFANMTDGDFGSLYLMSGGERHSLAIGAEDETILIDTKRSPQWAQPIIDKIKNVTDMPVKRIINTNAHNTGSNAEFTAASEIIAHVNTKANMAKLDAFRGARAKFLPNKTFSDTLSLQVKTTGDETGKSRVDLFYFGPGYTNGDIVVVLPQYGVTFFGDLYPGKMVPAIDVANGGSAVALPDTLDKAIAALQAMPSIAIIVPGVAAPPPDPILTKWASITDLQEYAAFTRAFLEAGRGALQAGKSVDEAVAALTLAEQFKGYDMSNAKPAMQAIYGELKKQ